MRFTVAMPGLLNSEIINAGRQLRNGIGAVLSGRRRALHTVIFVGDLHLHALDRSAGCIRDCSAYGSICGLAYCRANEK